MSSLVSKPTEDITVSLLGLALCWALQGFSRPLITQRMEKPRLRERKRDRSWPKKAQTGAEEMAQGVACLLCKHGDLNLNPQHHVKSLRRLYVPAP